MSLPPSSDNEKNGFGTFKGTFVPNVTMMFGVILFLRMGLIVAHTGPWGFATILSLSLLVMLITSLSIIPVVTNMNIGKGGIYYLISRSFGIEAGAAIGFALFISQLITIALCISGFAYTIHLFLPSIPVSMLEISTLTILSILSFTSADLALRIQIAIFATLLISVGTALFGTAEVPHTIAKAAPYYPKGLTFWQSFALFFPALTGIESGMALSGCLKNPGKSLSIGNISSLLFSALIYCALGFFLFNTFPTHLLKSNPFILISYSKFPALIYMGICTATLSSALGCLLGAPRMIQSIADDGVLPAWMGNTYGKNKEPRIAIITTFILAAILLLLTGIDQIIPILSMICLLSYGSLNFLAGLNEWVHSPNWRPAIHIPWFISLVGGILCIAFMLMISSGWALVAMIFMVAVYFLMRIRNIEVDFHDLRSSFFFFFSRHAIYHLQETKDHITTWHPQILAFIGSPMHHETMLYFANTLTQRSGILSLATVLPEFKEHEGELESVRYTVESYMTKNRLTGLIQITTAPDLYQGMADLIKLYGLGPIQPNTILFGLSRQGILSPHIIDIIKTASFYGKNIMLFRDKEISSLKLFKQPSRKKKTIDVWWDNNNREHFDLMLSYVNTLTRTSPWNGAQVRLQCVTHSISAQENLQNYFESYKNSARLKLSYFVHHEEDGYSHYPYINHYSADADLIFANLPLQKKDLDDIKTETLNEKINEITISVSTIFVASFDEIDHRTIY